MIPFVGALVLACIVWSAVPGAAQIDIEETLRQTDPTRHVGERQPPAASSGSQTTSGFPKDGTVKVGSKLNVRDGPWGKVIGKLGNGAQIKILAAQGEWYQIEFQGQKGFVHKSYITTGEPGADDSQDAGQASANSSSKGSNGSKGNDDSSSSSTTPSSKASSGGFGGAATRPKYPMGNRRFGIRMHPVHKVKKMHNGVDIPAPAGTPALSFGPGKVIFAASSGGAGRMVKVQYDNGYIALYMHLQSFSVRVGQRVNKGQEVGKVDSTGTSTGHHLHLGMMKNGRYVDPQGVPGLNL